MYDYPAPLDRPWVQVNFVASSDGAASVTGVSEGLSSPGDKRVFALSRDLADVVLVGVGTATVEGYHGIKPRELRTERRERLGLSPIPPIAVVSARCSVDPGSPLLTDTLVPPLVVTCAAAPARRREALAEAGADVVVAGQQEVDLRAALSELDARGLRRVSCEGGPRLFGSLVAEDLVDQLCLTVSPLLAGGDAPRVAHGLLPEVPRVLELASVLHEEGFLMLRYRRAR
nr:pyrimidine reductase family protein [Kutzneria albida]